MQQLDQEFGSEDAVNMHLKDKHGITDIKESDKKTVRFHFKKAHALILAMVVLIGLGGLFFTTPTQQTASAYSSVDGVQCNSLEGTVLHIHPHLSIVINNNTYAVPAQIGIRNNCLYWLHTHDASGTIHFESPTFQNFTLGQFLAVWNQTNQPSYAYTFGQLKNSTLTAYVDNTVYSGDYRNILLKDREQIRLVA